MQTTVISTRTTNPAPLRRRRQRGSARQQRKRQNRMTAEQRQAHSLGKAVGLLHIGLRGVSLYSPRDLWLRVHLDPRLAMTMATNLVKKHSLHNALAVFGALAECDRLPIEWHNDSHQHLCRGAAESVL